MKKRVKQQFTLIELLVVVAIIGIIAAILLPVIQKARTKARHAVDLSNLKQIATGAIDYTIDNNEQYPYRELWEGNQIGQEMIKSNKGDERGMMRSYLGDVDGILTCPHSGPALDITNASSTNVKSSYSMFWGAGYNSTYLPGNRMKAAGKPFKYNGHTFKILAADYLEENPSNSSASWSSHPDSKNVYDFQFTNTATQLRQRWGSSSSGAARGQLDLNFVFDDGHAETMTNIDREDSRLTYVSRNIDSDTTTKAWLPPEN